MNLIRRWLKNSGKMNVETDNLLDAIENRAIEEASEEFKQVFKSFDFSQKCD